MIARTSFPRAFALLSVLAAASLAGCTGEPPQDLTCTSDRTGNHLQWSPLPNATGYVVFRSQNESGEETIPEPIGETNETRFHDANVTAGTRYTYYVSGANETGVTPPATCELTSVPFFASPLAWALAVLGAGAVVSLIVLRRRG